MRIIKSVDELKDLASVNGVEVSIKLNYGLRSTKFVEYNPFTQEWYIENYIDGSVTSRLEDTNIEEAIQKGALFIS